MLALGKIGDKRSLETLAGLQRTAPRESQPASPRPSACSASTARRTSATSSSRCGSRSTNLGFQELLRASASGLPRWRSPDASDAAAALIEPGVPTRDPARAPIALALGTVALRNTPLMLKVLESATRSRSRRSSCSREAFDMLEEDFEEERFFVTVARRAYWAGAGRARPRAQACRALIDGWNSESARLLADRFCMDYKQSGVDIDAGNEVVRRIRSLARGTFTPGVLSEIGSFGGLFRSIAAHRGPGARRQRRRRRHQAARRVHDRRARHDRRRSRQSLRQRHPRAGRAAAVLSRLPGDRPARPRTSPCRSSRGSRTACRENGCALLGGETAEMPGFYADGEYDVAGFIVGVVDARPVIDGRRIAPGDVLIGLPSSGLHTNGYSLARRIAFESRGLRRRQRVPELGAHDRRRAARAASIVPAGRSARCSTSGVIKGMAHITGGGITDNLPRMLPAGTHAVIDRSRVARCRRSSSGCSDAARAGRRHAADVQHGHRSDRRVRRGVGRQRSWPTLRSAGEPTPRASAMLPPAVKACATSRPDTPPRPPKP